MKRPRKPGTRPSTAPRATSELMGSTFRWLKLDDAARSFAAMRAFALAAGARIGEHARAERLRGAILYVRCDSAAWAQHLHVMKAQLLERVRATVGGGGVQEIRFNIGPLDDVAAWERAAPTTGDDEAAVARVPPPEVARAFADMTDGELRERLARLYGKLSRG
jgi:hypothetical protein